jgi:hypothetical protein
MGTRFERVRAEVLRRPRLVLTPVPAESPRLHGNRALFIGSRGPAYSVILICESLQDDGNGVALVLHELGHHTAYEAREDGDLYEGFVASGRAASDAKNSDERVAILRAEIRAWRHGWCLAEALGEQRAWVSFRREAEGCIAGYVVGLKVTDEDLAACGWARGRRVRQSTLKNWGG